MVKKVDNKIFNHSISDIKDKNYYIVLASGSTNTADNINKLRDMCEEIFKNKKRRTDFYTI